MDEGVTKSCPNCKREIPAVNFTIHSVHCARNLKICPVCKEPVPGAELDVHHQKMHKLLPCKQCGESVCGTDLEDHIRDSCANTVKSCRFCELELPRRELPTHEGYCGVRTEQCPDCKEYVMIKYNQLHLDSNHGFIRLDDDPAPPKKEPPKLNLSKPVANANFNKPKTTSNGAKLNNIAQRPTSIFDEFPRLPSDHRPSSSNPGTNGPNYIHNVKNRPSSSSKLTPSTFGNPRPNIRPSTSNLGQSPHNSGSGSSDSRQSSYNSRPDSSNDGLISTNSVLSPRNSGAAFNPRPNSFHDRLGLIFAHPLPMPNNSESGSPNSRPGSSNTRPDTSNSGERSSNTRPDSSNSGERSSNTRQDSSNSGASSSNTRPDSSNSGASSSNTRPDSSNSGASSSNTRPDSSNSGASSSNTKSGSSNTRPSNFDIAGHCRIPNSNNIRNIRKNEVKNQGSCNIGGGGSISNISPQDASPSVVRACGVKKRTNDQPQINMDTSAIKTVDKDLGAVSRGAVKKRPAPQPPRASSRRDLPYYSAVHRQQREERERREQNEYNLAHGLPPVLNPVQKLEKLRKLDALQNRDFEEEYRSRQRRPSPEREHEEPFDSGHRLGAYQDMDEATRQEFKNLKPMSPSQFMRRFSSLQVSPPSGGCDRFPEIKSSLRELRRGLNEVTAPYNANNNITANNNNDRARTPSPLLPMRNEEVQLPCEFCNMLLPADDLVQHQTGCRPDLAQLLPGAAPPSPRAAPPSPSPSPSPRSPADPVIPCEFCMQSLPVYLITEHQEQCIQENMPV